MKARLSRSLRRSVAVSTLGLALASCSSSTQVRTVGRVEIESLLRSRGLEPVHVVVPYRLSPEMKKWLNEHVPKALSENEDKILYLSRSLFATGQFKIDYVRGYTGTAMEVFETRQANCLAFTLLFIGMARELGVPAYFLEVRDSENYRKEGDLIVVSDHVAVGYGPTHDLRIIDFGAREDAPYRRITLIDDYRAIAMFYSNRGAEELRSGRFEEALDWLRSAVAIDPGYAGSWVNLGVAWRRSGDVDNAEIAYRTALELDLQSTSALQNLAALLHFKGEEEEALDLLAMADRASNRNPFTYLTLGDLNMRHGRLDEAGRFYKKALKRQGENAESLAAMGLWSLEQGDQKEARDWLERAEVLDKDAPRVALLRRRLSVPKT
jgi:Flp pilus assembly protein TadD